METAPAVEAVAGTPAKDQSFDCWMSTIEVDATGEQNFEESQFLGIEDWSFSGSFSNDKFWGLPALVKDDDDKQNWIADHENAWTNCSKDGAKVKCLNDSDPEKIKKLGITQQWAKTFRTGDDKDISWTSEDAGVAKGQFSFIFWWNEKPENYDTVKPDL